MPRLCRLGNASTPCAASFEPIQEPKMSNNIQRIRCHAPVAFSFWQGSTKLNRSEWGRIGPRPSPTASSGSRYRGRTPNQRCCTQTQIWNPMTVLTPCPEGVRPQRPDAPPPTACLGLPGGNGRGCKMAQDVPSPDWERSSTATYRLWGRRRHSCEYRKRMKKK